MAAAKEIKFSSLASLPPPKHSKEAAASSASAAAAAGASDTSPVKKETTSAEDLMLQKLSAMIERKIDAAVAKRLGSEMASSLMDLPPPPTQKKKKTSTNAPVGQGILVASLRGNKGIEKEVEETAKDIESDTDAEDDDYSPAAASGAAAAAAPKKETSRLGVSILEHARLYGSMQGWAKMTEWKTQRNKHECMAIAQAVDALLKEGVPKTATGVEILLRRLAGVHLADSTGSWQVADSVAWNPQGNSLLPRDEVRRAFKDADQMNRLVSRTTAPRQSNGRGGGQSSYRGGSSRGGKSAWANNNNHKKQETDQTKPKSTTTSPAAGVVGV
jgi:hypothetical protein